MYSIISPKLENLTDQNYYSGDRRSSDPFNMNLLAVVTGGSRGIGKAVTEKLLRDGFDVITCARNAADLQKLAETAAVEYPSVKLYTYVADLSVEQEVVGFGSLILSIAEGRSLDFVLHNTGVFWPGAIGEEEPGVLEKTMSTNVYSAYHLTRSLLGKLKAQRSGHIFLMCSIASLVAYPNGGSYCISKFALLGMTKVLREELKPFNIRVTAVMPGATFTDSWAGAGLPESRFVKPEDIADTVLAAFNLSAGAVLEEVVIRPQLGDIA